MKQMEIKEDNQQSWSCFVILRDRPHMNTEDVLVFRLGPSNTLAERCNAAQNPPTCRSPMLWLQLPV